MNSPNPIEVTVLTSCYNAEFFLAESIESILNQSFINFEYLLINDGSTDNTLEILRSFENKDPRINIINRDNYGLAASLNYGLSQSRGKWIARLDADDIALPDRLNDQINYTRNHPDIQLIGGGCIEMDPVGQPLKKHVYPETNDELLESLIHGYAFFPHSSVFFKKDFIQKLGGYNPRYERAQDKDLWFRILEKGKIACIPEPVIKLRKHELMISRDHEGNLQFTMAFIALICHFMRQSGFQDPSQSNDKTWSSFYNHINNLIEKEGLLLRFKKWKRFKEFFYLEENKKSPLLFIKTMGESLFDPDIFKYLLERSKYHKKAYQIANDSQAFYNEQPNPKNNA